MRHQPKFDLDKARRLYEAGLSCRQVAEQLGVSYSRVAQRLRRAGFALRPSGRPRTTPAPAVDVDELVRLRQTGATYRQLAAHFNTSTDVVRDRYLKAAGQPRRTPL